MDIDSYSLTINTAATTTAGNSIDNNETKCSQAKPNSRRALEQTVYVQQTVVCNTT